LTSALTSILSRHRALRGNACHQFAQRGLILIDNSGRGDMTQLLHRGGVEFGLDGWILAFQPVSNRALPLLADDAVLDKGLIGVEILSQDSVGIGTVAIGQFNRQPSVIREAAKAALREAKTQLQSPAGIGFLLYDFEMDPKTAADIQMELKREEPLLHGAPILGFETSAHGIKYPHRIGSSAPQSVTILLLPL
jgi:hypothetical protein